MTKKEHTEIMPECLEKFDALGVQIEDIKTNHFAHLNDKIDNNTKWTKWGLGAILTVVGLGISLLGLLIALH